jgi:putative two-component system response regulator
VTSFPSAPNTTVATDQRKKILFVDDEPNFLAGLRRMLRGYRDQWDLHFAESVDSALALCDQVAFDTIVSDVNMPEKTGFDLLAALKSNEKTRDVPVIILTGNAESDLKRKALDCGATDLLNKPVGMEDLTARLRNVTKIKDYEDQLRNQNEILEHRVCERTLALEYSRLDIIWRLAKAGEFRDEDTGEHVLRVAACSRALSTVLRMDEAFTAALFATSPLHDIGKIGIPDGILLKTGKLTVDERHIMQRHCDIGAAILLEKPKGMEYLGPHDVRSVEVLDDDEASGLDLRSMAAEIALTHHEKWDGTGYPKGLRGDEIPVSGQIVAIADVYDALRSERAYKSAFSVDLTLEKMSPGKGSHFAPDVFDAFEKSVDVFEEIRSDLCDHETSEVDSDETHSFR